MAESDSIRSLFPFAFPGAVEQPEELEPPPLHDDLAQYDFCEIYEMLYNLMKPGEKILDSLKRLKAAGDNLDEIAKYISELYARGEVDIFDRDWLHIGISGGKLGAILSMKWEVNSEDKISELTSEEIAPKHRVFAALDSTVRVPGSDEWIPIDKINFGMLKF